MEGRSVRNKRLAWLVRRGHAEIIKLHLLNGDAITLSDVEVDRFDPLLAVTLNVFEVMCFVGLLLDRKVTVCTKK